MAAAFSVPELKAVPYVMVVGESCKSGTTATAWSTSCVEAGANTLLPACAAETVIVPGPVTVRMRPLSVPVHPGQGLQASWMRKALRIWNGALWIGMFSAGASSVMDCAWVPCACKLSTQIRRDKRPSGRREILCTRDPTFHGESAPSVPDEPVSIAAQCCMALCEAV